MNGCNNISNFYFIYRKLETVSYTSRIRNLEAVNKAECSEVCNLCQSLG